jgi:hypothetical protein
LFRAAVDFAFRRRMPALTLIRIGAALLALLFVGLAFGVSIPTERGPIVLSFSTDSDVPLAITWGVFLLGASLIVVGAIWTRCALRENDRKKVIVIELRGLRDTSGHPLADVVPENIVGRRDQLLMDIRQGLQDGKIIDPAIAVGRIQSLPYQLAGRQTGLHRSDISYVLGGLAPVPLSFLTGIILDDEGPMTLMDWNRYSDAWEPLHGSDDRRRFQIEGLDLIKDGTAEVALTVSVSYQIDRVGVAAKLPEVQYVHMELDGGGPDAHWSEDKQAALGRQFLETAIDLGNRGVRQIHLFLAAPSSVVFRFGRLYDKRNLPNLVVYQYQREERPPYPWGIRMPVESGQQAEVVR